MFFRKKLMANEPIQIQVIMNGQKVWLPGVVVERKELVCNHRQPFEVDEECMICHFLGDQPLFEIAVEHNGKKYLVKNVPPGNLWWPHKWGV